MRWPWVPRWVYEQAEQRARVAEDRLYAAHQRGAEIPPREPFEPHEPEVIALLPAKVQAEIDNWESAETRGGMEREARHLLFELDFPEERVLELWRARTGNETPVTN